MRQTMSTSNEPNQVHDTTVRDGKMPCHINNRALKVDGHELEQLAGVAMVEVSHVDGIGGCRLDKFALALCTWHSHGTREKFLVG